MDIESFSQAMSEICAHSLVSPGRALNWTIIANPCAGGFTIGSRWKKHLKILNEYRQKAQVNPLREINGNSILLTEAKGSGEKIARKLIEDAGKNLAPFHLIITAGGDGTGLEVLSAIYNAPAHIRSNMAVLRLPMGTGNDSADSKTLAGALDLLVKPVKIKFGQALQLITASGGPARATQTEHEGGPLLAFNILSVGLDAFVTHMTNKMKGKLPGDSYKLWVDIAATIYDRLYKVDYLDVRALDEHNRVIRSFNEKILLLAMGASGHRTYGSGKMILPNEHNVCGLKQMSLIRKLIFKGQVVKGKHTELPESIIFSANRLEFSGLHPILAQMDGETILLQPEDFPAAIELTAPVIPLLVKTE